MGGHSGWVDIYMYIHIKDMANSVSVLYYTCTYMYMYVHISDLC